MHHVGVGEEEVIAAGVGGGFLECIDFAEPSGGEIGIVDDADSGVFARDGLGDCSRAVGRVIVDDGDVEIDALLSDERTESGFERRFFIARGDDDADRGAGG